MSEHSPYIVNAFTANGRNGNPAGVMLEATHMTAEQMLAVAQQVGVSETAFVSSSSIASKKVRFFTPTNEVDLCGHATIATWSLLCALGEITAGNYTQETKAGVLAVDVQNGLVFMEQTRASFYETFTPGAIAAGYGCDC